MRAVTTDILLKNGYKPMLAYSDNPDLEKLTYPLVATPKLDGWRTPIVMGQAVTRSLKPVPNPFVREYLSRPEFSGLDGEVIVGEPTDPECFNVTDSAMKKEYGEPDFRFYVFDDFTHSALPYEERMERLVNERSHLFLGNLRLVLHDYVKVSTSQEILDYENVQLELGYEGLILRGLHAPYKYNRSTLKEQGMMKLKRWVDEEFVIVGYYEMMHNANEAKTNELGRTHRSKDQENMVPMGTLGGVTCLMKDGITTFDVGGGPGLTRKLRDKLWAERSTLVGQKATVKHFPIGATLRPRMPGLKGIRAPEDMS